MQISVKLIGPLVDQVPASGPLRARPLGSTPLELADGSDMKGLLRHIGLPENVEYFAMVNEQHVSADALPTHALNEGDAVVLLPPLKGG